MGAQGMKKFLKKFMRGLMAAVMAVGPLAPSVEAMPLAAFGPARAVPSIRAMSAIPRDRKGFFNDASHTRRVTDPRGVATLERFDGLDRVAGRCLIVKLLPGIVSQEGRGKEASECPDSQESISRAF
jgi:hypothetical protein